MKKTAGTFVVGAIVFALLITVALPATTSAAKRSDAPTIAEAASSLPQFSTLAFLLDEADLVGLVDGNKHYTVFAPDNDAFLALENAYPGVTACLIDDANVELLQGVLAYHLTRGDRYSQSLFPPKSIKMLNGAYATTSLDGGRSIAGASIIEPFDVRVKNGVIHAIDAVIVDDGTFQNIVATCYPQ